MLSDLDTCKIVRERETLPTVFRNESGSGKVHFADQAPGIGAVGGAWGRRKTCARGNSTIREIRAHAAHKTLRKLWRWAHDLGHVENDPMAKLKPLDAWGVNNEVLSPELFQRFLRVVQALEGPREGLKATQKYKGLLVYFVLGGLQGLRTCEMIRERANDPVIEWRDFLWKKKLIVVRDEVAKQTRARDKLRYVPLEPATIKLLKPLATAGATIPVADSTFYGMRQELCKEMRIRWPENCLRNSYATYAQTFRSSGDVARAMGDAESTVKRFYVQTLEPGVGKKWFNLPEKTFLGAPPKIVQKRKTLSNLSMTN